MSKLLVLLVQLWCWRYNRRWLQRGEELYFLQQLDRQHEKLAERWERTLGSSRKPRHALKEVG